MWDSINGLAMAVQRERLIVRQLVLIDASKIPATHWGGSMAYKFLDVIADIEDRLNSDADAAKKELQEIDARQSELESKLATLKPSLLRAKALKALSDLFCPECYIDHGDETLLRPIDSPDENDRFRCAPCHRRATRATGTPSEGRRHHGQGPLQRRALDRHQHLDREPA